MKIQAAVATAARKLQFTRSGAQPEGLFSAIPGHAAAGSAALFS